MAEDLHSPEMTKHAEISSLSPHFFRVVLFQHLQQNGTLQLPRKFVQEHSKSLSKYACLKVPTGVESKIELKKHDDQAWLDEGWEDFVKKYSIELGYFLVFRYEGESRFNVLIFDLSTSEIKYPRINHEKSGKSKVIELKEEETVKEDDGQDKVQKTKESRKLSRQNSSLDSARDRVLQRAEAFQDQSPYYNFKVTMKPAYKVYLHIPTDAARDHFRKSGNKNIKVILKRSYGRVWRMTYSIGSRPHCAVRICVGWNKFSKDNKLQEGDVCVFELIKKTKGVFKVTIFPNDDEVGEKSPLEVEEIPKQKQIRKRNCTANVNTYSKASQKAEDYKCNELSFTVVMRKSYVQGASSCRLAIPHAHSSKYLMDQHGNEVFLKGPDGETWAVKCYVAPVLDQTMFVSGWKEFAVENNLQEGDTCVFKLFSHVPIRYIVTISRSAES